MTTAAVGAAALGTNAAAAQDLRASFGDAWYRAIYLVEGGEYDLRVALL
jgi:hypothetical protein